MVEPSSPIKRSRPLSFALPSSSSSSFNLNTRPLSPDSTVSSTRSSASSRPSHRSTASLSSLAQLNLNGGGSERGGSHSPLPMFSPKSPNTNGGLERSPSLHWGTFQGNSSPNPSNQNNGVGKEFEHVQNKTFAKWLNARLEPHGYPPVTDLGTDFSDGTRLIQLIEVLTEISLGRYNQSPSLRVQKMENTVKALNRIKEMGVHLTNIGPEDIVDGNRKLILGMIWSLVLRFSIADINEEGSHAKDGLLLWCQRKTNGYERVEVRDFTKSWVDGLAFCALIHRHRPDLLDYAPLASQEPSLQSSISNLELAFSIAETHLGIPRLLDVEDIAGINGTSMTRGRPDERSLMTYVAQFFHAFSSKAQQESESRVISHFVENMSELMLSVHSYERRLSSLLSSISAHLETLHALPSPSQTPYPTLLKLLESFSSNYYTTTRRTWKREKLELEGLLGRIREKLRTYGLRDYTPPEGLRLGDLGSKWEELERGEKRQVGGLRREVERLRNEARERVERTIREVEGRLKEVEKEVAEMRVGTALEVQIDHLRSLQSTRFPRLNELLTWLEDAETQCRNYDVPIPILLASSSSSSSTITRDNEDDEVIIHSHEGLAWEFERLSDNLVAKIAFLENQITARKSSSLKPEQLEEFESAFRAFDKDSRNRLGLDELVGALGSLGVAEINLEEIKQDENEEVSFEEFIRFLTARNEDRLTGEKVRSCFRSVASEKGYVTELDLTRLSLPTSSLQFLKQHMPQSLIQVPINENTAAGEGGMKEEVVLDYEEFLNQFLE
ncbi:uncharacterized protein JCM6883_000260 [Sporobolomyces salmoneus]|uniref:uncharacterized protein n=1 Tax=Sporobolomyces salmoneus TaxID=183962 RepID=UPI0031746250